MGAGGAEAVSVAWRLVSPHSRRPHHAFLVFLLGLILDLILGLPYGSAAAEQERRIALVIGINAYQHAPQLINPVNDARAIGDSLRRLKFDVVESYDADQRALGAAIRSFGIRAADADVAVVYYAGHGVQVDRENYLIPSDARLERERDLFYEAIPVERLLGEVAQAGKIGILLLDGCRNNPFIERVTRSMNVGGRAVPTMPGLARVDNVPRNTMVVMAAKADQVAEDGQEHSPFAAAVLAHFTVPGLELGLFFRSVRDTVLRATSNRQEPYVFSSLGADPFYFYPRPPNRPPRIGSIHALELLDSAGPTPLGVPQPTDPDQDPLTIRVIGLPRSGEIRIEGRVAVVNTIVSVERFQTATYKPDGKAIGAVGTLDLLIEDGRGGSVTASLPIMVRSSHHPPIVGNPGRVRIVSQMLGIPAPISQDGDPLTVTIDSLPRGVVFNGSTIVRAGDRLTVGELTKLSFMPEAGVLGSVGALRYRVDNGHGNQADGAVEIDVAALPDAKSGPAAGDTVRSRSGAPIDTSKPVPGNGRDNLGTLLVAKTAMIEAPAGDVARYMDMTDSKALAFAPERHGTFRTGEWPTEAAAADGALEGCQVLYGVPCALAARGDNVLLTGPANEWPRLDMPRVRYAGAFDPGQIPRLREVTRSGSVVTGYTSAPQPKAMAFHPRGLVFSATGALSQIEAEERALAACNDDPERKGQDGPCYLYASGDRVVLPRRLTGPDPYSRIAAATRLVRPYAYDPAYPSARDRKALAFHMESARTFRWDNVDSQAQAEQLALEGCQQQYGDPCVLVATGDELMAPDPRTAQRRDMERLHYRGPYNVDKVPFLTISAELRAYPNLPNPKAIAVRPRGARSVVISGAATTVEAERKALQICNDDHVGIACYLYASGNQVVLPDRRIEAQ
jgi:hypothetical protein